MRHVVDQIEREQQQQQQQQQHQQQQQSQQIKLEVQVEEEEEEEREENQQESVISNVAVTIYGSPSPPEFKQEPEMVIDESDLDLDDPSLLFDVEAAVNADLVESEKEKEKEKQNFDSASSAAAAAASAGCVTDNVDYAEPSTSMPPSNLLFKCTMCLFACSAKELIVAHIQKEHSHSGEIVCCMCGRSCGSRLELDYHVSKEHMDGAGKFLCHIAGCEREFASLPRLNMHVAKMHQPSKNLKHPCPHLNCTRSYGTLANLGTHERIHHRSIMCRKGCGAELTSFRDRRKHELEHKQQQEFEEKVRGRVEEEYNRGFRDAVDRFKFYYHEAKRQQDQQLSMLAVLEQRQLAQLQSFLPDVPREEQLRQQQRLQLLHSQLVEETREDRRRQLERIQSQMPPGIQIEPVEDEEEAGSSDDSSVIVLN